MVEAASHFSLLQTFADGWNEHDVEKLVKCMSNDCLFRLANGQEHVGKDAVRAAFANVFATIPDAKWSDARHFVNTTHGVSESRFSGTAVNGTAFNYWICDVFEFSEGKIQKKDTYRKV